VAFPLYVDEDALETALIQALRSKGIDVVTTNDAGLHGYPDDQQLEYATSQGRVLYSCNKGDFAAPYTIYLTQGLSHGGIILVQQQRYSIGEQLRRIHQTKDAANPEDMRDQIVYLSEWVEC